jgi:uncharacterized protein YfaS (alpha-2-macroglobulin family)
MAEEIEIYFSGDTVRFTAEFRDYPEPETPGDLIDPDPVTVRVLDAEGTSIHTGTPSNDSLGIFSYEYTVPNDPGTYYIEFKGIVNSKPEVKRYKFKVKFWVSNA